MKAILLFKTQKFFLREFRVLLISFELSDKFGVNRSIYDSERTNLEVRLGSMVRSNSKVRFTEPKSNQICT